MEAFPDILVDHMAAGLCIPWCGSGISVPSGLPNWGVLAEQLVRSVDHSLSDEQRADAHRMIRQAELEDVIDFCRELLGEGEYREAVQKILGGGQPNALHRFIVALPVPAIVTTNYDRLLETAYADLRGGLLPVFTASDTPTLWKLVARKEKYLLKVHGDIIRPDTLVLTTRDYTKHVFGNAPFMTFVQRLLLGHSALFIGSSITDHYLQRILEETTYLTGGVGVPHYAIMRDPGVIRKKVLKARFNINVISYSVPTDGDHASAVIEILGALCDEVSRVRS